MRNGEIARQDADEALAGRDASVLRGSACPRLLPGLRVTKYTTEYVGHRLLKLSIRCVGCGHRWTVVGPSTCVKVEMCGKCGYHQVDVSDYALIQEPYDPLRVTTSTADLSAKGSCGRCRDRERG